MTITEILILRFMALTARLFMKMASQPFVSALKNRDLAQDWKNLHDDIQKHLEGRA